MQPQVQDRFVVISKLAWAFVVTPLLLLGIAWFLSKGMTPPTEAVSVYFMPAWVVLGMIGVAASRFLREQALRSHVTATAEGASRPDPEAAAVTAFFLGMAPVEAVGLLGFVGFLITQSWVLYAAMMLLWLAALPSAFPTRTNWDRWVQAAADARGPASAPVPPPL